MELIKIEKLIKEDPIYLKVLNEIEKFEVKNRAELVNKINNI